MTENREALIQHYQRMREGLLSAIAGLTDDQMSEPTIDGWSVKDHLSHLALWDNIRAGEVERISAGYNSVWRMNGDQDAVLNSLSHELRLSLSPDQAKWELAASRQRLLAAISSITERGLDASLYGEAGLHSTHEELHTGWIRRWRGERGY